jgi:hypothetical protein
MAKLMISGVVAASLFLTAWGGAYAAPWGSRSDPSYYLGKDYTGDWEGALESMRSGTRGHMGGQLPRAEETKKPNTKRERPKPCC